MTTEPRGGDYVTVASQGAWVLLYVVLAVPLLLFPGGSGHTRLARWLLVAILADAALFMVVAATAPGPFLPPDEGAPHALGTMPVALSNVLTAISLPLPPLTLIGIGVHLSRGYRAADEHRRGQFRWLALAGALLPVTLLATWVSYAAFGNADVVLVLGLTTMYLAVPIVIAVALLRPDLFDVERVLAGTATHATSTVLLLAVFTVADLLAGQVFTRTAPTIAVAATAVVALVLAPVRGGCSGGRPVAVPGPQGRLHRAGRVAHRGDALRLQGSAQEQLQQRLRDALHDQHLVVGYRTPLEGRLVEGAVAPDRPAGGRRHRRAGRRADRRARRPGASVRRTAARGRRASGHPRRGGPAPHRAAPR